MPFDWAGAIRHCGIKHTVNGDASRGAYGDVAVVGCVIDKFADHVATEAEKARQDGK